MPRKRNMANREICTLQELETAAKADSILRTNLCLMAVKALTMGIPHEQVAALFGVNEDSVSRWVRRFHERVIDRLTDGPRSGHPPKNKRERAQEYRNLMVRPEIVNETHWTERKFHGYPRGLSAGGRLGHTHAVAS